MDRDPVMETLIEGFAAEARDICQRLTGHVLELEHALELDDAVRRKHYEDLARGLHTLKGNSDTFGFPQLAQLAHKLEDAVAAYRVDLAALPPPVTDLLLRAIDVFAARITTRDRDSELSPLDELSAALIQAAQDGRARPIAPRPAGPANAPAAVADPVPVPVERVIDEWRVGPHHIDALLREIERLRELRLRLDEQKREVDRSLSGLQHGRVLDVAELRQVMESLSRSIDSDSDEAGDIVDALEQELRTVATLPLRWILDPLQRAVRDLTRGVGKEARLSCVGGEISLDRRLLEALQGPLVHLVRNAVDHGIESPEARIAAGKHREGAITIRLERTGNLVVLEIEDDGAGIDSDVIRETAIARGILTAEEAATIPEPALHQLLFHAGFSTRREITGLSGRGIGLDVVRGAVQVLEGHIEVHTTAGSGTRFVITVPATLGSTPILVVQADEHMLGIPMIAIETIRAVRPEDVHVTSTTSRFEYGGQLLPLYDLAAVLGLRASLPTSAVHAVVILQARGARTALAIDELVGDRDLVVRPLPPELHDLAAYQGAATLARGDLLLVLQPEFLVTERATPAVARSTVRRALVVDDSLTARALHRTMLESGGYQVHTVGSARQALDHLRRAYYDVVIADIMMAEIDGIELTQMLRARRETRSLPIVLVSARDTQDERARGVAAGADVFMSKKDCVSGRLLAEVASAIARREHSA